MYLTRLGDAPFSGEETRRAQVAREMSYWSDWIVPRQQGEPLLSRPPLHNWAIALVAQLRGQFDETSARLPSALAVLLTVAVIYGYGRTFLGRLGALSAAAAFATMGHVLQLGRLGEDEALYTLLVAASLLGWRWVDAAARTPLWPWCTGYALAALGMLTKGPQAPVYFIAGVGAFLIASGRWRELLRWPHAAGMALFLAIWGAWQIPFWLRTTGTESLDLLTFEIALRFQDATPISFLKHLATFPVEVLVCMLPWSVLLVAYLRRDFRRTLGAAAADVRFLACAVAATFPTCWFVPGARNRYFVPLYPCLALLIGLVVQRCCQTSTAPWARLWTWYRRCSGLAMLALGAWVLAATAMGWLCALGAQSLGLAALFATALALLGVFIFCSAEDGDSPDPSVVPRPDGDSRVPCLLSERSETASMFAAESCPRRAWAWHPLFLNYATHIPSLLRRYTRWTAVLRGAARGRPKAAVLGLAGFVGLLFSGLITNVVIARGRPLAQHLAEVRQRLPKGAQLVSIGPADPTFAFFCGAPMRQLPWEPAELAKESDWTYFCVDLRDSRIKCDFPYEELAVACCEPHDSPHPVGLVLVGRRLWPQRDLPEVSTARRLDAPAIIRR
jgi:4-amino-4-deoxy-L-arabinose transferase-like glycosyltransferase